MRFPIKVGLICAAIWIGLKQMAWFLSLSLNDIKPFVFVNMFLLTVSIAYALYFVKLKEEDSNLLNDIKNGMLAGMPYSVIVSVFLYFYYERIYPEFNQQKIEVIEKKLNEPNAIKEIQKNNPEMQNDSPQEIRHEVIQKSKMIYSSKFNMLVTLLSLVLYTTLNSILIALIFRKVVFANRNLKNSVN
jgi:hypothetical protein